MAAFLSGEMKDTVQMNPAGAYGALYLYFHQGCANPTCLSVGAILFKKRASKFVP